MCVVLLFCICILLFNNSYCGIELPKRFGSLEKHHSSVSLTDKNTHVCNSIADYFQQNTSFGGFPNSGKMYCAPVAVSNSLMSLLGSTLFQSVSDQQITNKKKQYYMIKTLASSQYIATGRLGSGPAEICKGVQMFLVDNNVKNFSISHYGWRPVPSQFQKSKFPNITILPAYLKPQQNAIWLNIGWYKHNISSNSYFRTGGHWVTLTASPAENKNSIIVHDPATREDRCETILLTTIENGTLNGNMTGLPLPAKGFNCFRNSFGKYGIIDGFIILELNSPLSIKLSEVNDNHK